MRVSNNPLSGGLLSSKILQQIAKIGEPRTTTTTIEQPEEALDFLGLGMLLYLMLDKDKKAGKATGSVTEEIGLTGLPRAAPSVAGQAKATFIDRDPTALLRSLFGG